MKRYLSFIKGNWIFTLLSPVFVLIDVYLEMKLPQITAKIIDESIPQSVATGDLSILRRQILLMLVYSFTILLSGFLAARCAAIASIGFTANMRSTLFNKVQDLSFENLDKFSTSSLITRIISDTNSIQMVFSTTLNYFIRAPFTLIYALIYAWRISRDLSKVFWIVIPSIVIVLLFIGNLAVPKFKDMLEKTDKFNKTLQENFIGIRVVKSFVREEKEKDKFNTANNGLYNATMSAQKLMMLNLPILMLIMFCCLAYTLWNGSIQIYDFAGQEGALEVGTLTAFTSYISSVISSLMTVTMIFMTMIMARASIKRVNEVLDAEPTITDDGADRTLTVANGDVEFKNVSFKYNKEAQKNVLENINVKINSGEIVGIIGATGSAKTTLISLIPRLYDATEGQVLVGGRDVKDYTFDNLHTGVSVVLQNNVLFSGTIKENLLWGNPDADDETIENACKVAQAYDFIKDFEDGFDTQLGQGGVNVSGGQKQRLCIARALLREPKILIFDDSTSAVDTATDTKIRDGLENFIPGTTKIIIAQRINSVKHADKIIILDDGKIVGMGSHDELLENSEIYREIYNSQQKGVLAQ